MPPRTPSDVGGVTIIVEVGLVVQDGASEEREPVNAEEEESLAKMLMDVTSCSSFTYSMPSSSLPRSEVSVSAALLQEPFRRPRLPSWHPISASCPAGTTRPMSVFEIRVTG